MVRLTQSATAIAMGLVAARLTMLETLREPFSAAFGVVSAPGGPGPGTGVVLDLFSWLPALLVLLRALIDRTYSVRLSWAAGGFIALAAWAAASVIWSADRFAAAVGASHLMAAAALLWASAQLVRSWLRIRLLAGLAVGLLLVHTAQGLIYRYVEWPELTAAFELEKQDLFEQRGWSPDSFMARQFTNKIYSGEILGFSASPNTYAAILVLLSTVAAGAAIQRLTDRDGAAWALAALLALPAAALVLWHTHSRTGLAVAMFNALVLLAWWRLRPRLGQHALVYGVGLAGTSLVLLFMAGWAAVTGSLFHESLDFRLRYWIGAGRVLAEHPLLGVGWDNFALYYLAHRVQQAAEEIRDPHSFLVRGFVELGAVGGVLLMAWVARLWWEMTRPAEPPAPPQAVERYHGFQLAVATAMWIAAVATAVVVFSAIDWSQPAAFVWTELFKRLLYGSLLFGGILATALRSTDFQQLDDRPAAWMLAAACVSVGGLMLHGLLDVALFETGPLMLVALLAGAAIGARDAAAAGTAASRRAVAVVLGVVLAGWLGFSVVVVGPVVLAQSRAAKGDAAARQRQFATAAPLYQAALETVPCNADYAARAAGAMIQAGAPAGDVRAMLDRVLATNPRDLSAYLTRAGLALADGQPNIHAALADYQRALALNPADLPIRIEYAGLLARDGRPAEAAAEYRQALERNAQYHPDEPERLTQEQVARIERAIDELVRVPATRSGS